MRTRMTGLIGFVALALAVTCGVGVAGEDLKADVGGRHDYVATNEGPGSPGRALTVVATNEGPGY
ncbi:hypothetical protein ACOBQB_28835 [Streptomyces sp. G5(2025)]|uniref:hypothetical protein n=1 Tax=Streptomyces sp. G5(2025) TaxID=3406628 RepID=UPI003C146080